MNEKAAAALLAISVQLWVKSWAREPEAQDGFGKEDVVAFGMETNAFAEGCSPPPPDFYRGQ